MHIQFYIYYSWRYFWMRETGTGRQVAQLHDRYDDDDLLLCRVDTAQHVSGTVVPIIRSPLQLPFQPLVTVWGCKGSWRGLLMMDTTVPETRWAVSTRQTLNIRLIVHLVGSFIEYLKIHGTTNPKSGLIIWNRPRNIPSIFSTHNLFKILPFNAICTEMLPMSDVL
jgi:hypothetical protein